MGRRFPLAAFALVAAGCFSAGAGPEPPADQLYFPVGLVVSPAGKALYVANSDFDLQYNAGTVQVYDLDAVRRAVPRVWDRSVADPCGQARLTPMNAADRSLFVAMCGPIGVDDLIRGSAQVGAFATDALYVTRPAPPQGGKPSPARLFVPVRGDPSVTWLDVDDDRAGSPQSFRFECGQGNNGGRCDAAHQIGTDPNANSRSVTLPAEPFGIAATENADAIVVTHQTTGELSLITAPCSDAACVAEGSLVDRPPILQFLLGGLPYGATGVAPVPVPAWVRESAAPGTLFPYQPGFLVTFTSAAQVDLVRYYDDAQAAPARPFLTRAGATPITVAASGYDSRGIVVDPTPRRACEAACPAAPDATRPGCLQACAGVPMPVYAANRAPAQLLIGETRTNVSATGSDDLVTFYDAVPLAFGASRVVLGSIRGRDGLPHPRVFVVCFDSRLVFVYDPDARRITGEIRTGRGPHSFAIDPIDRAVAPSDAGTPAGGHYAYIGHFTDSFIGVVDLDESHADTFQTMVAVLGQPRVPRSSK